MAGIYKFGYSWGTPYDEAIGDAVATVEANDKDEDPIFERGLFWTEAHKLNNEFVVRIETRAE